MEERVKELSELPPERIALRLKAFRRQCGLTQEALAKRLGIKRNTLLRWENCKTKISKMSLRVLVAEGVL